MAFTYSTKEWKYIADLLGGEGRIWAAQTMMQGEAIRSGQPHDPTTAVDHVARVRADIEAIVGNFAVVLPLLHDPETHKNVLLHLRKAMKSLQRTIDLLQAPSIAQFTGVSHHLEQMLELRDSLKTWARPRGRGGISAHGQLEDSLVAALLDVYVTNTATVPARSYDSDKSVDRGPLVEFVIACCKPAGIDLSPSRINKPLRPGRIGNRGKRPMA